MRVSYGYLAGNGRWAIVSFETDMPTHEDVVAELKRRAEIQVDTAKKIAGIELDYSETSVALLDKMIDDLWGRNPPNAMDSMVALFGAYLGEVVVRQLDGRWAEKEGGWAVDFELPDGS